MEAADAGQPQARRAAGAVTAAMQRAHDPSLSSYYVNDALYQEVVESFSIWQRDELVIADPSERDRFRMLIERSV